jgi:hypothetical protein
VKICQQITHLILASGFSLVLTRILTRRGLIRFVAVLPVFRAIVVDGAVDDFTRDFVLNDAVVLVLVVVNDAARAERAPDVDAERSVALKAMQMVSASIVSLSSERGRR